MVLQLRDCVVEISGKHVRNKPGNSFDPEAYCLGEFVMNYKLGEDKVTQKLKNDLK